MTTPQGAAAPSSAQPITGGCLCGEVRYEVIGPFVSCGYCHCTRCQRRTGTAASVNARLAPGDLRVVAGDSSLRTYRPVDGAPKVFCALCGSGVFSGTLGGDGPIGLRVGGLDSDPGVRPQYHQYVDFAPAWLPVPDDGLPRHAGARPH